VNRYKKMFSFPAMVLAPLFSLSQTVPGELVITIDAKNTAQTIQNIGASGCWFSEGIGKYWPVDKKEKIAGLLFSKAMDANGHPEGIGLSAWRFNIGGGTAEQGDSSGIKDPNKRVECFLDANGTYNWNKQAGYQWFLRKAKAYGVENLIAFSNTPPVQFTQNGLGYKTAKDYRTNLKADKEEAYADFLTEVIKHFDGEGLHFNYISPVNEPQWDWSNKPGEASQEGTPWRNEEIYRVMAALDQSLEKKELSSQMLATEAGALNYLYDGASHAGHQIRTFYGNNSSYRFGNLKHSMPFIAGHSYFTDTGDSAIVATRQHLADTAKKYNIGYWQSEYSMLGDGFREGTGQKRSPMDCALFLAKMIHQDLTVGNAAAWQFWNAYEPGSAHYDTRYYLIALQPNAGHTDGSFTATKNLWALGNYSLFVRPGMKRLHTGRGDGLDPVKAAQDIMVSAFTGGKDKLVMIAVNYTHQERPVTVKLSHAGAVTSYTSYITSAEAGDNLKAAAIRKLDVPIRLLPRSVTTIVFN
jgi:O-glycosyl hydrolase